MATENPDAWVVVNLFTGCAWSKNGKTEEFPTDYAATVAAANGREEYFEDNGTDLTVEESTVMTVSEWKRRFPNADD